MKKMNKGFTLIELMLAVMIIAIIAAIALPSYQAYVRKSLESNVQQEIQKIMRDLEHQKSRVNTYLEQRDSILKSNMSQDAQQQAIQKLRDQQFNNSQEQLRLGAFETTHDTGGKLPFAD